MSKTSNRSELDRLRTVLDAHGANPARWPASDAARLAALAQADPAAQRMLREAEALDRVLAAAPASSSPGALANLADRIVASAAARPAVAGGAEIVALPVRARASQGDLRHRPRFLWTALAALAASLVIGFYAGTSSLAVPALQQVAGLSQDEPDAILANAQPTADEADEGELL